MKQLLKETYQMVAKMSGINVKSPRGFYQMLADPESFKIYAKSLAQGLNESARGGFLKLAKNTRRSILENSTTQITPYETLTIPLLRNFYPKLIAKELVNVMPIDKPEVVKYFIRPTFSKVVADATGASYSSSTYAFPAMNDYTNGYNANDISRGPGWGYSATADATSTPVNVLTEMGIDAAMPSHLERDFTITGVLDETGAVTDVAIRATVDGNFAVPIVHDNGDTDILSGYVDFENGILHWTSADPAKTTGVRYQANASLEENSINAMANFEMEKINLSAIDRRISTTWTTNMEQDVKSLFDITLQSELINILGEQIALDIDSEIINDLLNINTNSNPATHTDTFCTRQPVGYVQGPKEWLEQIIPTLNNLSAQVFNSTQMGGANTIACNPLDAAILESLNSFEYLGDATAGGDVGYRSATVASGKWKALVSSNVPVGKMIVKYRSDNAQKACYIYAPYVPALLLPYPLGANPTLTVQTRYAKKAVRPKGFAVLNIDRVNRAASLAE